ncbi:MAG: hypothetical protein WBA74_16865 [Cyclobacteriaceae bacterium]
MEEQEQQELIEKYLNGELTGSDKAAFEEKLSSDDALKESVSLTAELISGLKGAFLRQEIAAIHREEQLKTPIGKPEKDSKPVRKIYWTYGIAASIGLLMMVWLGFFQTTSDEDLFAEYYQEYPNLVSLRNNEANSFTEGMKYYTAGQYEKAIPLLESETSASQSENERKFYLSISYLSVGQADKAIDYLQELDTTQNRFQQQVNWYLGLALLYSGNKISALSQLQKIKIGEYQYDKSRDLINKLE